LEVGGGIEDLVLEHVGERRQVDAPAP
jgi:hypothetical protein